MEQFARTVPTKKSEPQNRRGSPEAIAKRRAARLFNEVVAGPERRSPDGRTERRRTRMLAELAEGTTRSGQSLKPIEVLARVQALLDLGEPLSAILAARALPAPVKTTGVLVDGLRRLHAAYAFAPEVYRFVGVDDAALALAGIAGEKPSGPGLARAASAPVARSRRAAG